MVSGFIIPDYGGEVRPNLDQYLTFREVAGFPEGQSGRAAPLVGHVLWFRRPLIIGRLAFEDFPTGQLEQHPHGKAGVDEHQDHQERDRAAERCSAQGSQEPDQERNRHRHESGHERGEGRVVAPEQTGSAQIDQESRRLLDNLVSVALRCDRFMIEIAGHTDNVGARAANLDLSLRRAEAVRAYLAGQGVARDRLRAQGYGPDRPRASNATAVGQAANRRIEFTVTG